MIDLDRIGFGCVALSSLPSARAARRLLEGVLDLGVTHFDTAPIYGRGYSERILGDFLRDKRDRVSVATKFGLGPLLTPVLPAWLAVRLNYARNQVAKLKLGDWGSNASSEPLQTQEMTLLSPRCITRAQVEASFEQSRRALRTDYFDLYLLHEGLPSFLEPSALDYLCELKESGRVHRIGLAAAGNNYHVLSPAQVASWDVLQYEFGPAWQHNASLPGRFPDQLHIFHSCLKGVAVTSEPGVRSAHIGRVLAECLRAHPGSKVLFSSTNLDHVRANLRAFAAV